MADQSGSTSRRPTGTSEEVGRLLMWLEKLLGVPPRVILELPLPPLFNLYNDEGVRKAVDDLGIHVPTATIKDWSRLVRDDSFKEVIIPKIEGLWVDHVRDRANQLLPAASDPSVSASDSSVSGVLSSLAGNPPSGMPAYQSYLLPEGLSDQIAELLKKSMDEIGREVWQLLFVVQAVDQQVRGASADKSQPKGRGAAFGPLGLGGPKGGSKASPGL